MLLYYSVSQVYGTTRFPVVPYFIIWIPYTVYTKQYFSTYCVLEFMKIKDKHDLCQDIIP